MGVMVAFGYASVNMKHQIWRLSRPYLRLYGACDDGSFVRTREPIFWRFSVLSVVSPELAVPGRRAAVRRRLPVALAAPWMADALVERVCGVVRL